MNNIDILEEKLKIIESLCTDDCINKETVIKPLKQAIENLIAENKELKEKNKELQKYMKEYLIPKSTINLIYIQKSKVEEEIHYLEECKDFTKKFAKKGNFKAEFLEAVIKKLEQSLLGKE